ncbi:GMP synthase [Ochromonadaceae sp. CCMP2298]|nr:GMP synthase [Ochromonadaceae sp. CCMP2298]
MSAQLHSTRQQIAILDFGSQYSHLIARRVRELNVFCELFSCLVDASVLSKSNVVGIILSGGPSSVYDPASPHVDPSVWKMIEESSIPVLGICYGMQEIAHHFGGEVSSSTEREYGRAMIEQTVENAAAASLIFEGVNQAQMWMSHGDKVTRMPEGFFKIAHTSNSEHAAIADPVRRLFGLQFHPEVTHSVRGKEILQNFVVGVCSAPTDWNMKDIANDFIKEVRERVGPTGHVIGAVSGGVDSTVAACLLQKAIGSRFHAIMVDNACLRKNEAESVVRRLKEHLDINLTVVDASERFLTLLDGVIEPETKRKIIGKTFIDVFQEEANKIEGDVEFLLQGTLYPDVIESVSYKGPSATIKTHHNVGGLPASMKLKLIEPLRELFKDEVRELGMALGIEAESVWRHPFPGPGLAIRVLGEITRERLHILREADDIMIQEIRKAGVYNDIGQAFVVLLPVKSVGVMGDSRTYEQACAIRCVTTADFMTADWYHMDYELLGRIANRIINEVKGINRVCYDVSSKPPATIEWE